MDALWLGSSSMAKTFRVELVRAGLAWHYKRYSADPALAKAESNARAAGIGIWSLPKPVPPWELKAQRAQTGGGRRR